MSAAHAQANAPVHPLDLLYERSCTMAERVLAGQVDFIDGVDACYSAAEFKAFWQKRSCALEGTRHETN